MVSTTVRIRDEDKERLRRLQKAWVGAKPPTQTDLVALTLEFALRHRDEFMAEAAWKPLTPAEIRGWDGRAAHLGAWDATDDASVYEA